MNVTDMGEADAKRLVDFSAGLVFGLRGSIERVTNKVFLLSPSYVEVIATTRRSARHRRPSSTRARSGFSRRMPGKDTLSGILAEISV